MKYKIVTRKYRHVAYAFYKGGKKIAEHPVVNTRIIPCALKLEHSAMLSAGLLKQDDYKIFDEETKERVMSWKKHLKADRVVRFIREGEVSGYVFK